MTPSCRLQRERGAVLIHVAIAVFALIAFTSIVVDYGLMWVARRQAQAAADAAALAGAHSMAFDGVGTNPVPVHQSAQTFANKHTVWAEQLSTTNVDIRTSLDTPPFLCPDGTPTCVQVDVFRGAPDRTGTMRGTPLPVFFARLFGINEQGVRATATAEAGNGDTTECLKPWAIADKWEEIRPTVKVWEPSDTFDKWVKQGNDTVLLPEPRDYYEPWQDGDPPTGTGFNPGENYGMQMMLKNGTANASDQISSGWFLALDLPCASGNVGADCYRENIRDCTLLEYTIGDTIVVNNQTGNMVGPTEQGVMGSNNPGDPLGLYEKDPDARWVKDDPSAPWVPGQPQPGKVKYSDYAISPRIVPVPLFDVDSFFESNPNGQTEVTIVNIMGFFIEGTCSNNPDFVVESYINCKQNNGAVVGRLVNWMGTKKGTGTVVDDASFLKIIQLVR